MLALQACPTWSLLKPNPSGEELLSSGPADPVWACGKRRPEPSCSFGGGGGGVPSVIFFPSVVASEESGVFTRCSLVFLLASNVASKAPRGALPLWPALCQKHPISSSSPPLFFLIPGAPVESTWRGAILEASNLVSEAPCGRAESHAGL